MANPLYGQNKADSALQSAPKIAISAQLDLTSTAAVYPVLEVPAGTYVHSVQILVTAAITAGSMDIDIGDGDDADRFYDGWTAATGALALGSIIDCPGAGAGVQSGRYYVAADTIDIDINTVATAGKVRLLAHCSKLGALAPASLVDIPVSQALAD